MTSGKKQIAFVAARVIVAELAARLASALRYFENLDLLGDAAEGALLRGRRDAV